MNKLELSIQKHIQESYAQTHKYEVLKEETRKKIDGTKDVSSRELVPGERDMIRHAKKEWNVLKALEDDPQFYGDRVIFKTKILPFVSSLENAGIIEIYDSSVHTINYDKIPEFIKKEKSYKRKKMKLITNSNEKKEKEKVLTPQMQCIRDYVINYTQAGRFWNRVKKNPDTLLDPEEIRMNTQGIGTLKNLGIIKKEKKETPEGKKEVTEIHDLNLKTIKILWKGTKGPKILELFGEDTELTVNQTKDILGINGKSETNELSSNLYKLKKSGFLDEKIIKPEKGPRTKTYSLSEHLKKPIRFP